MTRIQPNAALYLPCTSPVSPLYFPCISPVSPLHLTVSPKQARLARFVNFLPISPLYLPCIFPTSPCTSPIFSVGVFLLMWGVAGGFSILNNFTLAVYNWQQGDLQVVRVRVRVGVRVRVRVS